MECGGIAFDLSSRLHTHNSLKPTVDNNAFDPRKLGKRSNWVSIRHVDFAFVGVVVV